MSKTKKRCSKCHKLLSRKKDFYAGLRLHANGSYYLKRQSYCKRCMSAAGHRWIKKNKKKVAMRRAKGLKERRLVVLNHYSNNELTCNCCHERNHRFLTLDHVNGGGGKWRKRTKKFSGDSLYRYLINHAFPSIPKLQVLCFNCNLGKAIYGKCPHLLEVKNGYRTATKEA